MRSKIFKKLLATAFIVTSLLLSVGTAHAVSKLDLSSCLDAGGATSWMSCPMIDTVQKTVNDIFVTVLQEWLEVKPQLFTHTGANDPGGSVFSAWQYFQGIANIAIVIYLFIVILSQFTGVGISNYGIKKALPRILLCAVLVNLSYIICQIAVDMSNIAGSGMRALFDNLVKDSALVARGTSDTGITIAVIAVVIGLLSAVIVLMKISPVFIVPVMISAIGLLLAVIFLFLVLGVRQVLAVLLVVVSPIAIICYSVPGLNSVYKKWFGLFKAVLLAYPIAAIMMGAGSLAAQILYQVWDGDNNFFAALGSMLVCIVPYFFIPSVIKGSIGKLTQFTEQAKRGIHGFAGQRLARSDMAKDLKYKTDRNRAYRWSGIKTDSKGNIKRDKDDNIKRSRFGSNRHVDTALKFAADERELENMKANPDLMQNREDRALEQEAANRIKLRGEVPEALGERLAKAQDALSEAAGKGDKGRQEVRMQEAEIKALTRALAGSSGGRKVLRKNLSDASFGGSRAPLSDNVKRAMGSSLSMEAMGTLSKQDPRLAKALTQWGNAPANPPAGSGAPLPQLEDFSSPGLSTYTADMLDNFSDEDFANLNGDIMEEMMQQSVQSTGGAGGAVTPQDFQAGNFTLRNDAFSQTFISHCERISDDTNLMGKTSVRRADIIKGVADKSRNP